MTHMDQYFPIIQTYLDHSVWKIELHFARQKTQDNLPSFDLLLVSWVKDVTKSRHRSSFGDESFFAWQYHEKGKSFVGSMKQAETAD